MFRSVLVIDSDELSVKLERTLLEADGWHVMHAKHAAQATILLENFRPDLIITALGPARDAADAAVAALRPRVPDVPIVAVTAVVGPETEYDALRAGCAGYITKPIDISTFSAQLRAYLGGSK